MTIDRKEMDDLQALVVDVCRILLDSWSRIRSFATLYLDSRITEANALKSDTDE